MLTTAEQVRLRIQDRWRWAEENRYGDGSASAFKLAQGSPYSIISAASALVAGAAGWSGTGAAFDTGLGLLTFSGVPSANTGFKAVYQWAVFSDADIEYFTAAGAGTVPGAALEAVRALMFDSLKRARWAAPDGTQYDDTKAQDTLTKMHDLLLKEIAQDLGAEGGIESWSETQAYWSTEYNA